MSVYLTEFSWLNWKLILFVSCWFQVDCHGSCHLQRHRIWDKAKGRLQEVCGLTVWACRSSRNSHLTFCLAFESKKFGHLLLSYLIWHGVTTATILLHVFLCFYLCSSHHSVSAILLAQVMLKSCVLLVNSVCSSTFDSYHLWELLFCHCIFLLKWYWSVNTVRHWLRIFHGLSWWSLYFCWTRL